MFVLDTNTVIHFFKGVGNVAQQLLATPPSQIAVPAIVVYALRVGIEKSVDPVARHKQLDSLLYPIIILPLDEGSATAAVRIRAKLEVAGTPIGPHNVLIAGTAMANGATLVTHNTREFQRVQGLELEDWYWGNALAEALRAQKELCHGDGDALSMQRGRPWASHLSGHLP